MKIASYTIFLSGLISGIIASMAVYYGEYLALIAFVPSLDLMISGLKYISSSSEDN